MNINDQIASFKNGFNNNNNNMAYGCNPAPMPASANEIPERSYIDGTIDSVEYLEPQFPGLPADAMTLVLHCMTRSRGEVRVYIEISSRKGRSEYTKDKTMAELAATTISRIVPGCGLDEADPKLVGMPVRLLESVSPATGKPRYFVVDKEGEGTGVQPSRQLSREDIRAKLAAMRR